MNKQLPFYFLMLLLCSCSVTKQTSSTDTNTIFINCETTYPSPCDLISFEDFVEISGSQPRSGGNYNPSESATPNGNPKICEIGFEDEMGVGNFLVDITLYCFDDFENSAFNDDITMAAQFPSEFEPEPEFEIAFYDDRFNQLIIRKNSFLLSLDFGGFDYEQQMQIANIMYYYLPD